MKLMISGVTLEAAIVRSPSFSRSSSSTTTTIRPARMSSMASGMALKGMLLDGRSVLAEGEEPLHVLGDDVHLEVDPVAGPRLREVRLFQCIRDDGHGESAGGEA